MLDRDNRMTDIQIVLGHLRIATFFASTTILIVAGLSAALGAADQMMSLVKDLPLVQSASRAAWEVKILMLIVDLHLRLLQVHLVHPAAQLLRGAAGRGAEPGAEPPDDRPWRTPATWRGSARWPPCTSTTA